MAVIAGGDGGEIGQGGVAQEKEKEGVRHRRRKKEKRKKKEKKRVGVVYVSYKN